MERQTISIMKACELVGVSRRTIYNWIAAGKVEYVRTAGGSIRIFVDTLWRQPDGTRARRLEPRSLALSRPDATRSPVNYSTIGSPMETGPQARSTDLRGLFHELNNQLGVILAHAELMEIEGARRGAARARRARRHRRTRGDGRHADHPRARRRLGAVPTAIPASAATSSVISRHCVGDTRRHLVKLLTVPSALPCHSRHCTPRPRRVA